jgi:hypothetical protein
MNFHTPALRKFPVGEKATLLWGWPAHPSQHRHACLARHAAVLAAGRIGYAYAPELKPRRSSMMLA